MSLNIDVKDIAYIRSESEFSRLRVKAFLEMMMGLITGHNMHLLSFDRVVEQLRLKESIYLGLQEIPIDHIAGSTGRYEDFTRRFLPRSGSKRDKERWRNIYTLAVTGQGFPPIDAYKIDQVYFVKDGNHRVSVARELGWKTIQGLVTELPSYIPLKPDIKPDELLAKEEAAYFLEKTWLDKTRPECKDHIHFSTPGGYQRLLKHIELHRYLLEQEAAKALDDDEAKALHIAAADWYDNVYLPVIDIVKQTEIIEHFPGRSISDLYMWLIKHQAALRERHDMSQVELPDIVDEFLQSVTEESDGA